MHPFISIDCVPTSRATQPLLRHGIGGEGTWRDHGTHWLRRGQRTSTREGLDDGRALSGAALDWKSLQRACTFHQTTS